ncbi:hypothetical protein OE09_2450 [Flavobacteriaceae bacterium MAR_2010_72]|nr:hypothetical protein OE09_2450 [Flavobacteriaceae bacterium MAR_2010_72]TVZ58842.1 hypothetical protein NA63_1355 [Flavobacteriaceae bacterium MAR_2010_105]
MKTKILLTIAFVLTQIIYAQTVRTVDNRPESGAQFDNVPAAIAASAPGDIIYIHPSPTSYGSITIDKTLTLVGPGHNPANSDGLRATLSSINLAANSVNSVIKGLNISSISAYSFGTNSHNIHILNNRITASISGFAYAGNSDNWIIEGNYFDNGYSSTCITASNMNNMQVRNNYISGRLISFNHTNVITNNLFVHEDTAGTAQIFTSSSGITSPLVTNNMFVFTDPDITELTSTGTPIVYTNCLTWKEAGGVALIALPGSGNVDNADPLFTNPNDPNPAPAINDFYNNAYTLLVGSPAIGAATDGGDIGVFGRNFPFDINGRPSSMPYPTEMTILNSVVQPGQNLNVIFKASQKN